ncbi:MAG: hypothetical protein KAI51_02230, partial [Candidatus Aenigmarchaeota archaeon]|nr:hypothetical protein [Candidatus Aenigmarchaeota archaeon]
MERKDKYIYAFLFVLLAAMTCVPAHAADLPTTIWMIAPEIQLDISTPNVPYGDNQTIQISLYNPNDYAATGNLSMKIGYRTESGSYEYLSENMLESNLEIVPGANETLLFIYNWSSLGHAEGTYKAYLRFDYNGTYTTRYKTFDIVPTGEDNDTEDGDDGEQDGEERLEIISMQDFLDFGSVSTIGIRYDSGPYEHGKLRIIGYVSGPKKASNDLDGKTIYMNLCETNTGVELRGVRSKSRFYLNIPLMLKDNCDSTYPLGDYEITVRVCAYEESRWIYYKDNKLKMRKTVRLDANGKCPDSEPTDKDATICEKQSIYNDLIENTCTDTQKDEMTGDETKTRVYEVLEFDENIYAGNAFLTKIRVYNNSSEKQNGTIYSYVYDNKTLISDGFNGQAWSHNWNANKVTFELMPFSNTTIDLMNKVDNAP